LIWFEYLNASIRVVTVNKIKLGNRKIWEALNGSHEEEGKKGKLGERKSVRMVELNQWVLMRERNRLKMEEESWRAESTGVMGDEESSEGLTDKHERKKQRILKQINGMNKRK
jgi:hypothetical protein